MRLDKTNLPVSISRWCLHISLKRFSGGSNHCCLFFPQLLIQKFPSRLFSLADFCNLCPSSQSCRHSSAVPLFPLSSGRIRVGKPGGICAFSLPQIKTVSFSPTLKGSTIPVMVSTKPLQDCGREGQGGVLLHWHSSGNT